MSLPCLSTPLRFIPIPLAELCLPTVLKCGQAFRWVKLESVVGQSPLPSGVTRQLTTVGSSYTAG